MTLTFNVKSYCEEYKKIDLHDVKCPLGRDFTSTYAIFDLKNSTYLKNIALIYTGKNRDQKKKSRYAIIRLMRLRLMRCCLYLPNLAMTHLNHPFENVCRIYEPMTDLWYPIWRIYEPGYTSPSVSTFYFQMQNFAILKHFRVLKSIQNDRKHLKLS